MERLGDYVLSGTMTNKDSGFSVWCFGERSGQAYFIKEFLSPKYPHEDPYSPPELIERKKSECRAFEEKKRKLYGVLNQYSDGNSVRIRDFFRVGSKYYVATPKVDARDMSVERIATMPEKEIRRLCAIVAHAAGSFHAGGLVHGDIKPNNILFATTRNNSCTAKLIDFDSSFLESDPPSMEDEIVGDQIYFSPEAWLVTYGYEAELTCKMDVFALGILFHQYFTGALPGFDPEAEYPGKAVAQGMELTMSPRLPDDVALLLRQMTEEDPRLRPDAMAVFRRLAPAAEAVPKPSIPTPTPKPDPVPAPNADKTGMDRWFGVAGDL